MRLIRQLMALGTAMVIMESPHKAAAALRCMPDRSASRPNRAAQRDDRYWSAATEGDQRGAHKDLAVTRKYGLDGPGNEFLQHATVNIAEAPYRKTRLSHLVLAQPGQQSLLYGEAGRQVNADV